MVVHVIRASLARRTHAIRIPDALDTCRAARSVCKRERDLLCWQVGGVGGSNAARDEEQRKCGRKYARTHSTESISVPRHGWEHRQER